MNIERPFLGIFSGKKVLITGHTGFKGSWLSLWLTALGADVAGLALPPPTKTNLFDCIGIKKDIVHKIGDVRDPLQLERAFYEHKPEIVFHLAAQPLVRYSYRIPRETYETNVMGTVNLLETLRHAGRPAVCIVVTSDKCYENREWVYAYRENDPLGGFDPYSASKACAELVVSSYRNAYFNEGMSHVLLSSVRAGNVIGGGDWAKDRIVPDAILALANGNEVPVRNPLAVRPWQYVLEPLAGYLWLAAMMLSGGHKYAAAWNFGPGSAGNVSVRELVENIIFDWGEGSWADLSACCNDEVHEANFLKLDCTKAYNILQWRSAYDIRQALKATVDWYREYYQARLANMMLFTLKQIDTYTTVARDEGIAWAISEGERL